MLFLLDPDSNTSKKGKGKLKKMDIGHILYLHKLEDNLFARNNQNNDTQMFFPLHFLGLLKRKQCAYLFLKISLPTFR
jgi:hypothetical protein